jgi:hypothetical protein
VIGKPEQRSWHSPCGTWIHDRQTPRQVCAWEATNVELLLQSGVGVAESPLGVNFARAGVDFGEAGCPWTPEIRLRASPIA